MNILFHLVHLGNHLFSTTRCKYFNFSFCLNMIRFVVHAMVVLNLDIFLVCVWAGKGIIIDTWPSLRQVMIGKMLLISL